MLLHCSRLLILHVIPIRYFQHVCHFSIAYAWTLAVSTSVASCLELLVHCCAIHYEGGRAEHMLGTLAKIDAI